MITTSEKENMPIFPMVQELCSFDTICSSLQNRNDAYVLYDGTTGDAYDFFLTCYKKELEIFPITPAKRDATNKERFVLPHLIRFDSSGFLVQHCRENFGKNAFIFVLGDEDMLVTIPLLERMLWVAVPPDGKLAWFRFHAPNIFKPFFSMATEHHLAKLFNGSLKGYWVEHIPGEDSNSGQEEYSLPVTEMSFFPSPYSELIIASRDWMKISPAQLDTFEEARFLHFTVGLCRHIAAQKSLPDDLWPDMRRQVESAIDQAAEFGILSYPCMCLYIDAALRFGWNFAMEHPELKEVIPRLGLPDSLKEDVLRATLEK
jgi:hypothetical protein